MLDTLGGCAALGQAELKVVLYRREEVLEPVSCPVQETLQQRLLVRLQTAGHTVLVDTAAAVVQAALTDVLSGTGGVDIAAAVHQQVLPLTDVAQLIGEQRLALDGVPALSDLPAAVAQVKTDLPRNAVVGVPGLQEGAVPYGPLLLFQGAGEEVDQG